MSKQVKPHGKDVNKMALLEHRHYATIATVIHNIEDEDIRRAVAEHFAAQLRGTNPRYDRDRFYRAATY